MALERFIPKSPDMFIRNGQDFEVAKFGHLNTIVEYINNNTVQPAGLNGYVQFNDNAALGGDAGLFWDNVNKRLGVGTVTPLVPLNIYNNNAGVSSVLLIEQDTSAIIGQINQYRKNGSVNLVSGAEIGRLSFGGYFNSTYSPFSQVCSAVLGYYGGTGTDRVGGLRLVTWNGGGQTTRLQVSPDGKIGIGTTAPSAKLSILGEGSTSATSSLLVQNSASTQLFRVYDDGTTDVGVTLHFYPSGLIYTNYGSLQLQGATRVQINNSEVLANADDFSWANSNFLPSNSTRNNFQFIGNTSSFTNVGASGTSIGNVLKFNVGLATTVGNVTLNHINIDNTINTTAGTTLQRGFYYNPTLTSTVGFTHNAIETVTGNVLLGTTSGFVGIGTSSPTSKLYLDGGLFTKKYYTDTSSQTINFGSAYELFGTPHASSGYSFFINPTGFSSGWDVNIGDATTYFNFNYSTGFSAFKVNATALILGESQLSFYKSSPDTGWSYNSAGGWNFVIRGSADEKLKITSGGNVLINTTTDLGGKLSIKGSGSTSATTSFLVQNSSSTTTFSVNDAGELSLGSTAPKITLGGDLLIENTVSPSRKISIDVSNSNLNLIANGFGEGYFIGNRLTASSASFVYVTPDGLNNLGSSIITAYDGNGNVSINASNNGNRSIVLKGLGASGAVLIGNITTGNGTSYSAILQADSTTQGFLPPRMTNVQRAAITTPAIGLMVYCTDSVEGLYVYKST